MALTSMLKCAEHVNGFSALLCQSFFVVVFFLFSCQQEKLDLYKILFYYSMLVRQFNYAEKLPCLPLDAFFWLEIS